MGPHLYYGLQQILRRVSSWVVNKVDQKRQDSFSAQSARLGVSSSTRHKDGVSCLACPELSLSFCQRPPATAMATQGREH